MIREPTDLLVPGELVELGSLAPAWRVWFYTEPDGGEFGRAGTFENANRINLNQNNGPQPWLVEVAVVVISVVEHKHTERWAWVMTSSYGMGWLPEKWLERL